MVTLNGAVLPTTYVSFWRLTATASVAAGTYTHAPGYMWSQYGTWWPVGGDVLSSSADGKTGAITQIRLRTGAGAIFMKARLSTDRSMKAAAVRRAAAFIASFE